MDKDELFRLVKRGDAEALRAALEGGADPRARDRFGVSLLYRAAARGDEASVGLLLERGAEIDRSSDAGNTPLMVAAARGHLAVIERLIAGGAAPGHRNKWGFDAAKWADWAPNGDEVKARLYAAAKA
ncbi:Ankyrin repeat-containing protein [Tistlia consotensis]|uniref:Ankyrin repeat-containing protein n=1 Tax=Tistlia consotensis USBA 355 TaxID=560819 RepID=A0A1Y6C1G4_9PROT|nr:ankyrin repeat domain-containing protein [Tistlia consotensis]SMF39200.1 Ankyrin repeat-containing protein [Tistlia consotensis USBA 355]SNR36528.1 Ankyrin repeat-containing protein [Tistlia consotensis]